MAAAGDEEGIRSSCYGLTYSREQHPSALASGKHTAGSSSHGVSACHRGAGCFPQAPEQDLLAPKSIIPSSSVKKLGHRWSYMCMDLIRGTAWWFPQGRTLFGDPQTHNFSPEAVRRPRQTPMGECTLASPLAGIAVSSLARGGEKHRHSCCLEYWS